MHCSAFGQVTGIVCVCVGIRFAIQSFVACVVGMMLVPGCSVHTPVRMDSHGFHSEYMERTILVAFCGHAGELRLPSTSRANCVLLVSPVPQGSCFNRQLFESSSTHWAPLGPGRGGRERRREEQGQNVCIAFSKRNIKQCISRPKVFSRAKLARPNILRTIYEEAYKCQPNG